MQLCGAKGCALTMKTDQLDDVWLCVATGYALPLKTKFAEGDVKVCRHGKIDLLKECGSVLPLKSEVAEDTWQYVALLKLCGGVSPG